MIKASIITYIERCFNILDIVFIFVTLFMAFAFQIILHELPCPLCLLQRVGFIGIAFGFLLNLRFRLRPSHYAVALISALFTSFVALRQIALHVVPGTGSYGSAIFGLHFYTWSFIIAMAIVVTTTLMLGIDRQYQSTPTYHMRFPWLTRVLFVVMLILIAANIFSVLLECGFSQCPDNPTHYKLSI